MLVCVDTNVMLHAFARHSECGPLFDALVGGKVRLAVSTSILLEYEEIAAQQGGAPFAGRIMRMISLVDRLRGTVVFANPAFQFNALPDDPDDNKFVTCAVVAQADYVITHDAHFAPLAGAGYKPQPITPVEFIRRHLGGA